MRRIAVLTLLFSALAATPARAQSSSAVPACPEGNLLANKKPMQWQEVRRELSLLTDEAIAPEGAQWDSQPAVIFDTAAATATWDLGQVTLIRSFALQADANDTYTVWGSVDGTEYKVFGQIDPVPNHGLRMRVLNVGGMPARYVRVGEGVGDSFYSISEFAAYCQVPSPFPPAMKVVDAPAAAVPPKKLLDYWDNDASARWELTLALLGIWFIWWETKVGAAGKAPARGRWRQHLGAALNRFFDRMAKYFARSRVRNALVGVMGVLAFLTYFNFGWFHFPNFIHGWDTFHYYIGSKYFKELSYERLYECVAIADSEEPGLRRRVELRKMTNLRTNVVETTANILAHPELCKQHFTDARWESFKHDLAYFRTLENPRRWDDAQTDHGFNATPVWAILGTTLSNLAPASRLDILLLDAIDVVLITIMAGLMWWAFGWRAVSVALMVFATNFPSRWYWIGGSFLRWDWLFWMGVGVCLVKKERPFWAGAAIAYAALLRIFPGFLFAGPLIALGYHYVKTREWDRRYLRMIMGGAVAVAVLVPVSFAVTGSPSIYPEFLRNTAKHSETPLTNHMGLRTVIDFRPAEAANRMNTPAMVDPWLRWKQARLKSFHESLPLYLSLVACFLVLMGLAIRKVEPWVTVALSATVISFASELTCYYYAFLIIPALLYAVVPRAGEWMLWLTALTEFLGWAPINHMPKWLQALMPASIRQSSFVTNFSMPNGLDEQYTWMSVATLVVFVLIARELMLARQPAGAPALGAADANAGAVAVGALAASALAPVAARSSRQQRVDSRSRTRKHKRR